MSELLRKEIEWANWSRNFLMVFGITCLLFVSISKVQLALFQSS